MSNEPPVPRPLGLESDQSLLLVLSAPSGTGKTTLGRRLVEQTPGAVFSISCTTRAPRGDERDGIDYHFLAPERFREMLEADAFAEWARVHDHFYGTPRATVEEALAHGRVVLFDIDVQGGGQLKSQYPETVTVFLLPPSREESTRRLRSRGTETEEQIQIRLLTADNEIRQALTYDYLIVDDTMDAALDELKAIVRAERLRTRRINPATLGF